MLPVPRRQVCRSFGLDREGPSQRLQPTAEAGSKRGAADGKADAAGQLVDQTISGLSRSDIIEPVGNENDHSELDLAARLPSTVRPAFDAAQSDCRAISKQNAQPSGRNDQAFSVECAGRVISNQLADQLRDQPGVGRSSLPNAPYMARPSDMARPSAHPIWLATRWLSCSHQYSPGRNVVVQPRRLEGRPREGASHDTGVRFHLTMLNGSTGAGGSSKTVAHSQWPAPPCPDCARIAYRGLQRVDPAIARGATHCRSFWAKVAATK